MRCCNDHMACVDSRERDSKFAPKDMDQRSYRRRRYKCAHCGKRISTHEISVELMKYFEHRISSADRVQSLLQNMRSSMEGVT